MRRNPLRRPAVSDDLLWRRKSRPLLSPATKVNKTVTSVTCVTSQLAAFRKLQIIKTQEVDMTVAHIQHQLRAHSSIDVSVNAAMAFVGRYLGAIVHGWHFAEACCRASRCRDDAAPTPYLSHFGLDRTSEGPFAQ
jgi:hypothetical protein